MFTGVILGLGIAAAIWYVHKVGLPKVLQEIKQTRVEMVAAIHRHASFTSQVRPSPVPLARNDPSSRDTSMALSSALSGVSPAQSQQGS